MGELETARRQHKAPWPEATEQEDRDYDQGVQLGDTEFETEVAEASAPQNREYVDAERASVVPGSWNLKGMYIPKTFADDEEFQEESIRRYGKVFQKADATLEADRVYAIGAQNARPELWSHEFMHRNNDERGNTYLEPEEFAVRRLNAFRASTPDQWLRSVELHRDKMLRRSDSGTSVSLGEAEEQLKKSISMYEDNYIRREAEYAENKGNRAKSRNWAIDTHSADAREAMEHRQKSWNIEDAVRYKQMLVESAAQAGKAEALDKALEELEASIERSNKKIGQE